LQRNLSDYIKVYHNHIDDGICKQTIDELNAAVWHEHTFDNYDNKTKMTNDKIKDIENAQITKSAAEKDSELLLVSDNYKYVILGIVSLLLSIVTIKGLRIASS
jgi:hypothetical protein